MSLFKDFQNIKNYIAMITFIILLFWSAFGLWENEYVFICSYLNYEAYYMITHASDGRRMASGKFVHQLTWTNFFQIFIKLTHNAYRHNI